MASTIILPGTPSADGVTFEFEHAKEFILDPAYNKPALADSHTLYTSIKVKTQIPFLGLLGLSGKADTTCGVAEDGSIPVSEKFWDPAPIKSGWSQCWNDLYPSLLRYSDAPGTDRKDLTLNALFVAYMADRVPDSLAENVLRRAWFSDTAMVGGDLATPADLPFFNLYDGFWKQIFDGVTATTIYRHTITENGLATKALQDALAVNSGYNAFKGLYENIDTRIFAQQPVYLATRSLVNNVIARDEQTAGTNGKAFTFSTTGQHFFRDIPVIVRDDFDRNIRTYLPNTTTWDLPHRLVLTTRENLAIGVDTDGSASSYNTFYDQVSEKAYFQARLMEDAVLMREFLTAVAY